MFTAIDYVNTFKFKIYLLYYNSNSQDGGRIVGLRLGFQELGIPDPVFHAFDPGKLPTSPA